MRSDTPALRTRRVLTVVIGAALLAAMAAVTVPTRPSSALPGRLVPVRSAVLGRPALAHATLDGGGHTRTRPYEAVERSRHPKPEDGDGLAAAAASASGSALSASQAPTKPLARAGTPLATSVAPSTDPATPSVTTLGQVTGIDAHLNVSYYGGTYEPSDPVVAASPSYVFEMVNTVGRITPRAGGSAINLDLGKFFDINHTTTGVDLTDPRVLWDVDSSRWFASAAVYVGSNGSAVTLAVSKTSDPTGDWWLYTVASSSTIFHDQPRLALTSDKVVMAWDDFSPTTWVQSALGVVAKAATIAGTQPAVGIATDTRRTSGGSLINDWYAITPAVQSVSASRGYAVYDTSFSKVGVLTIDGVPGSNLTVTETGVGFTRTSAPPQAIQPGTAEVDTGDDRFQSAVTDGTRLWLAGNDACTPAGDTTTRACLRLVELGVDTSPRLLQDIDAGLPGTDLYYPAVALDASRNLVAVYSFSSIAAFPSLGVLTQPAAGGALTARTVAAGTGSYTGSRWGDYAAAVADPVDPNSIWVVGQTKQEAATNHFWTTAVALVTVTVPAPAPAPTPAPTPAPAPAPAPAPVFVPASAPATPGAGYWFVASDGGIFTFGARQFLGSTGGLALSQPIVGMASTPDGAGYWLTTRDGRVFAFGSAPALGSTGSLSQPIVGMAATPSGQGYWLVASDGGIFAFGDARFFGSTGAIRLNQPIVGMAATPTGGGYWLVARDGGIFAFGDAGFFGSTGAMRLNQPIVGMSSTSGGHGYWFVASDGGIFSFGDASFYGSTGAIRLNQPIVGMRATPSGNGYWFVASDGGIFSFGDAPFLGSTGNIHLNRPITGMT